MAAKTPLPFGSWPSPITAQAVAKGSRRIGTLQAAGGFVYWTEQRAQEQGRQVILRAGLDGRLEELLAKPFSARSRVHEYGGGEFLVAGASIYFVNDADQQIYRRDGDGAVCRISNAPHARFADLAFDGTRERLIAVAEIHPSARHGLPRNGLAAIALAAGKEPMRLIAEGSDFYASPRLSPDGRRLAFLAWNLPDMPWDGATLKLAEIGEDGSLRAPRRIAGGAGSAAFQPEWSSEGDLYYVSDAGGFGALYRFRGGKSKRVFGARGLELMRPQWVFGARSYALAPDGMLACIGLARGMPRLAIGPFGKLRGATGFAMERAGMARLDDPFPLSGGFAAVIGTPVAAPAIVHITPARVKPLHPRLEAEVAPGFLSKGKAQQFRGSGGRPVWGFYYAPVNAHHRGPSGAAPPALIFVHGGPTAMTDRGLKLRIQFFTSRGFAVFDVNYSGSSGFGRAYRQRLEGAWGIADVADCVAAARHLARTGAAEATRIAICGGSAGGYTTLMALATSDAFAAGSSHYGVSDLRRLLAHTHKFESGYLHRLMGTTPNQWQEVFAARSPLKLIDAIKRPVILFQGLEDKIVPPEQSERMALRLKARGIDAEYHAFAGEGHGFRSAPTIIAVLKAELAFLRRVLLLA
jgi:dipeptidyl aminopeptidase/acylaminoacyl peptidase